MKKSHEIGLSGEKIVGLYLQENGYKILTYRYKTKNGEIDIIARENGLLCFVEVKYRPSARLGEARCLVNEQKLQHIRQAIHQYLQDNQAEEYRIDLIEITRAGIWHIKDL